MVVRKPKTWSGIYGSFIATHRLARVQFNSALTLNESQRHCLAIMNFNTLTFNTYDSTSTLNMVVHSHETWSFTAIDMVWQLSESTYNSN